MIKAQDAKKTKSRTTMYPDSKILEDFYSKELLDRAKKVLIEKLRATKGIFSCEIKNGYFHVEHWGISADRIFKIMEDFYCDLDSFKEAKNDI